MNQNITFLEFSMYVTVTSQTILLPNCLSAFDHFVRLALKGLIKSKEHIIILNTI